MNFNKISPLLRLLMVACLLALIMVAVSQPARAADDMEFEYDQDGDLVMMEADDNADEAGLDLNAAATDETGELALHL